MSLASGIPLSLKASTKYKTDGSRPEKPSGFRFGLSQEKVPFRHPRCFNNKPCRTKPGGRDESEMNQPSND